jgi:hypothetical protein
MVQLYVLESTGGGVMKTPYEQWMLTTPQL